VALVGVKPRLASPLTNAKASRRINPGNPSLYIQPGDLSVTASSQPAPIQRTTRKKYTRLLVRLGEFIEEDLEVVLFFFKLQPISCPPG